MQCEPGTKEPQVAGKQDLAPFWRRQVRLVRRSRVAVPTRLSATQKLPQLSGSKPSQFSPAVENLPDEPGQTTPFSASENRLHPSELTVVHVSAEILGQMGAPRPESGLVHMYHDTNLGPASRTRHSALHQRRSGRRWCETDLRAGCVRNLANDLHAAIRPTDGTTDCGGCVGEWFFLISEPSPVQRNAKRNQERERGEFCPRVMGRVARSNTLFLGWGCWVVYKDGSTSRQIARTANHPNSLARQRGCADGITARSDRTTRRTLQPLKSLAGRPEAESMEMKRVVCAL